MTTEGISAIRLTSLGFTGLCAVAYAVAALMTGRPDPVGWWWPATAGVASAVIITVAAFMGGRGAAKAATDELYRMVTHRAERQAYWVSMALFTGVAVSCSRGLVPWDAGFAALGCLMGASFLLLFVWHDLRMR